MACKIIYSTFNFEFDFSFEHLHLSLLGQQEKERLESLARKAMNIYSQAQFK